MVETFLKIGPMEVPVTERSLAPLFLDLTTNEGFINLKNRLKGNLGMTRKYTKVESLLLSDLCWIAIARSRMVKKRVSRNVRAVTKTTLC